MCRHTSTAIDVHIWVVNVLYKDNTKGMIICTTNINYSVTVSILFKTKSINRDRPFSNLIP